MPVNSILEKIRDEMENKRCFINYMLHDPILPTVFTKVPALSSR